MGILGKALKRISSAKSTTSSSNWTSNTNGTSSGTTSGNCTATLPSTSNTTATTPRSIVASIADTCHSTATTHATGNSLPTSVAGSTTQESTHASTTPLISSSDSRPGSKKNSKRNLSGKKSGTNSRSSSGNKKDRMAIFTDVYEPPSNVVKHDRNTKISMDAKGKAKKNAQINSLLKTNTQQLMKELTPDVRKAFETLFERIDITETGGITAKEIQHLIHKHTHKTLTLKQVQQVLHDLDVKGTGDIEFDEFIFMLSQPSNYIRLLDKQDLKDLKNGAKSGHQQKRLGEFEKLTNERNGHNADDATHVFFEALRNATKQDSMTALRTFYKNRLKKLNDHVIHDWSAGQRCIGLSDQEMLKRYETIQAELLRQRVNFCKDNSYKQSPYARPLEWGVTNLREAIMTRRKYGGNVQSFGRTKILVDPRRVKMSEFVVTPKAVPLPRYVIKKRSPLKRTFNYDQLADIRDKVDDIAITYYNELKHVARDNSIVVKKELAVDDIKQPASRQNFMHTFEAYCAPFVVSPWIPMPSPTLQASFAPLGKSKLGLKTGL